MQGGGAPGGPARRGGPLLVALVLLLVLLAAWGALQAPAFRLQRVAVTGNQRVPAAAIQQLLAVPPGAVRWRYPAGELRERLLRLEPWLQDARVAWQPGGVLAVAVTERQPVALLPYYNLYALVDAGGIILDLATLTEYRLPVIAGIPLARGLRGEAVRHPHLAGALQVLALLSGPLVPDEVSVSPAGDLTLVYRGPVAVLLGPPERLEEKAAALAGVDPAAGRTLLELARQQRRTLDLRNPNRPTFGAPR